MSPDPTSSATSSKLVLPADEIRAECIRLARSYIGTPWKHKGRSRTGIDCIGLPYVVGKELGLHDYDDSMDYGRVARNYDFMRALSPLGVRVRDMTQLKDADILIMRIPIFPQHVVMASHIGNRPTIIHASVDARKVVEEDMSNEVKRMLIAAFRYKDLA